MTITRPLTTLTTLAFTMALAMVLAGITAQASLTGFNDAFDYTLGDFATNAPLWAEIPGSGGGMDVIATPTGSTSGANVIDHRGAGSNTTSDLGRGLGVASDGDVYEFRMSVYTGTGTANDDTMMRITNNTSLFSSASNKNIVFQIGINDGNLVYGHGITTGSGLSILADDGASTNNTWYEFRVFYTVLAGVDNDTIGMDYRNVTLGGSFGNFAALGSVSANNELSTSVANNFVITGRDFGDGAGTGHGLAADDAVVAVTLASVPEPASLALLGLGGLMMVTRRR